MPIIQVNMLEGRTIVQKRALVAAITEAVCKTLGAAPQSVRIIINELQPDHYAVAGVTAAEQPLAARHESAGSGT